LKIFKAFLIFERHHSLFTFDFLGWKPEESLKSQQGVMAKPPHIKTTTAISTLLLA